MKLLLHALKEPSQSNRVVVQAKVHLLVSNTESALQYQIQQNEKTHFLFV